MRARAGHKEASMRLRNLSFSAVTGVNGINLSATPDVKRDWRCSIPSPSPSSFPLRRAAREEVISRGAITEGRGQAGICQELDTT